MHDIALSIHKRNHDTSTHDHTCHHMHAYACNTRKKKHIHVWLEYLVNLTRDMNIFWIQWIYIRYAKYMQDMRSKNVS